jgi:hypothetical protein
MLCISNINLNVMKINTLALFGIVIVALAACNHSKPKPISKDITKTTVAINGKKDSVINNPKKNYGNATVSEPCVKCLLQVVQNTGSFKKLATSIPRERIIYNVNWITSSKPLDLGNGSKIINGMEINVNQKTGGVMKTLTIYVYNNAEGKFYSLNKSKSFHSDENVSDASLKKIRNSCFWGVASNK